jgi:hypothetical protein
MPERKEPGIANCSDRRVFAGPASRSLAALLVMFLAGVEWGFSNQFRIEIHGGLSIPSIRGGNTVQSQGYTSRLGPFYGISGEWMLSQRFSLCAEISSSSQGGKRNGMQPITADQVGGLPLPPDLTLYANFRNETIIDYVEIPLMAKFNWGRTWRVFAGAGPYVGFRVRAKTVTSGMSSLYIDSAGTPLIIPPANEPLPPLPFDATTDVKSEIHPINVGITGGVGLSTPFGPGDIILSARFSVGLTNIQKNPEINGKNNTGAAIVLVGYAYTFGNRK